MGTKPASRTIKQMVQNSPKSTVKLTPIEKDKEKRGTDSELKKLKAMLNEFSNKLSGKFETLDANFTGMTSRKKWNL